MSWLAHEALQRASERLSAGHADLVGRLYDTWADAMSLASWYSDERIFERLDRITSLSPQGRILEIGFGDGRILHRLAKKMPHSSFVGVDLSERMISLAARRCSRLANVRLFEGDWISPVKTCEPFDVILLKNVLHLVQDPQSRLRELERVSHGRTRLVIVETVSPSGTSCRFISEVFRIFDRNGVKLNFFTRSKLQRALKNAGWLPRYIDCVDQRLSVDQWLKIKLANAEERNRVRRFIEAAPDRVVREMNISDLDGDLKMLRRQLVLFLDPVRNQVMTFPQLRQQEWRWSGPKQ